MSKWCKEYVESFPPNVETLQKEINLFIESHDAKMEKEKQQMMDMDGIPDEEGWITVTASGKYKGAPRVEEVEPKRIEEKNKKNKKLKRKQLIFQDFFNLFTANLMVQIIFMKWSTKLAVLGRGVVN
ncbi:hypothetical protein HELRODRAFT_160231 [Helobdella robusta]|uniref:Ribosomal RNA-processing protein 7 C-terminal domain-containing protein n=1 Tax=Helobdella robusta TaxID=6412 RepID=T1EQ03_HELRO|nr:hypothetical protein HELRODRAFT_160231 [Helobdella robusta]ESO06097.1 hypothetical protein HELRODRAFT_160231 [Helobdella robusta]